MNLLDDLGNDLAFAFLVENRHREKINSKEVVVLIEKIKDVLKPVSTQNKAEKYILIEEKSVTVTSV